MILRSSYLRKSYSFLLINTCSWIADHEILTHDSESRSELIFVSASLTTYVNQWENMLECSNVVNVHEEII